MVDFGLLSFIVLIVYGIVYVKKNYVIMTVEEWQPIVEAIEEYNRILDEAESTQELAGGTGCSVGFGADYLEDEEEEEE